MTRFALRAASLAALPLSSMAHEGHGADAVHWHATDTWGFLATLALMGLAIWASRSK